jgi:hypothetical protein
VVRDEDKEQVDDEDEHDEDEDEDEDEDDEDELWSGAKAGVNFKVCDRRLERALLVATLDVLGAAAIMVEP